MKGLLTATSREKAFLPSYPNLLLVHSFQLLYRACAATSNLPYMYTNHPTAIQFTIFLEWRAGNITNNSSIEGSLLIMSSLLPSYNLDINSFTSFVACGLRSQAFCSFYVQCMLIVSKYKYSVATHLNIFFLSAYVNPFFCFFDCGSTITWSSSLALLMGRRLLRNL